MTDTTEPTEAPGWDRRRFIKASAGGAALVWAAPTITGLNARAFAAGSDPDCVKGLSDNFDADGSGANFNGSGYATVTSLINFTISGGNVDIIGEPGQDAAHFNYSFGEDYYVDLAGTNPPPTANVTLRSRQCFDPGCYRVTLRYAGDQRGDVTGENSFTATLGDGTSGVVTPASSLQTPQSVSFTGNVSSSADNHLVIQHIDRGANNIGVILLSVVVEPCTV
jgi:hypothetical protein